MKVRQCMSRVAQICRAKTADAMVHFWLFLSVLFLLDLSSNCLDMQARLPQHENIKFLAASGYTASQSWRMIQRVYGDESMSRTQVQVWHQRFMEGDGHTPCHGQPPQWKTKESVGALLKLCNKCSCW